MAQYAACTQSVPHIVVAIIDNETSDEFGPVLPTGFLCIPLVAGATVPDVGMEWGENIDGGFRTYPPPT